jgi:hypothetical protein
MGRTPLRADSAVIALTQVRGFSWQERRDIIALVREQTTGNHAVDQAYTAMLKRLGPRDFQWPEFDHWHSIFTKRGAFPPLWNGLEYRPRHGDPFEARDAYQKQKCYLLLDWLYGLIATRAEMRTALARYSERGLGAEIARQTIDISCPACDPLNHGPVLCSSRDVPPFHPGCRCLILAAPSGAAARQAR